MRKRLGLRLILVAAIFAAGSAPVFAQSAPAISVTIGGTALNSNDVVLLPDTTVGTSSKAITITVTNDGTADLTAVGENPLVVSGDDAGMFVLDDSEAVTALAPGQSTSFTASFDPTSTGAHAAEVVITTNDPNNPSFTFLLAGNGVMIVG